MAEREALSKRCQLSTERGGDPVAKGGDTNERNFSFFRSFARRFHSFDELSNRVRRFFLDLIRPKISTIERKKFKTCELFSKT